MRSKLQIRFTRQLIQVFAWGFTVLLANSGSADKKSHLPPLSLCYDGPIDNQKADVPPRLAKTVDPEYTDAARKEKIQGVVRLELVVTTEGKACPLKIVRGLKPELDLNAAKAVEKWIFEPARKNGKPVATTVVVEVSFRLY
jgi:TonB family protein